MRLITVPGVFKPRSDTWMLADALRAQTLPPGATVLDVCTGSGAIAVRAALAGWRATAVDVSRRAVVTARINARLNGVRIRALRGDLLAPVGRARFDAIVSNPPYVPSDSDALPRRGAARAWDAGRDGRAFLDRLLADAPAHLRPGGVLLVVHSSVCGVEQTLDALRAAGLESDVPVRRRGPLGPLLTGRAAVLRERHLLDRGTLEEELVVIRGRRSG